MTEGCGKQKNKNKSSVTLCTPISVPPPRAPFFRVSGHKIQEPLKDFSLRGSCCRGDRIRTCDPLVPNQMRYQLRYTPNNGYFVQVTCTTQALTQHREIVSFAFSVVGVTGFEPATPWSQTRCATNCATPRNCFSLSPFTMQMNDARFRNAKIQLFFYFATIFAINNNKFFKLLSLSLCKNGFI